MLSTLAIALLAAAPAQAAQAAQAVSAPAPKPEFCPEHGVRPAGCVEPPLKDKISIYSYVSPEIERQQNAAGIIRSPVNLIGFQDTIPLDLFPAQLHRGELETNARIELRVVIGADGAVMDCEVVKIDGWEGPDRRSAKPIEPVPGIGESGCALLRRHGRFQHGIDAAGRPAAAPIVVIVEFERRRREDNFAPPPSPPSRWIGAAPYDWTRTWPPRIDFFPAGAVNLKPPRWKDFVAGRKDLPGQASVGVLLSFAPGGALTGCKIGKSSGDSALDAATCQALAGSANQAPIRGTLTDYPVEVQWKKDKARLVYPRQPVVPALTAPIPLADADVPAGPLPGDAIRLKVQIDPSGKVLSCRITSTWKPSDAFDARSCALVVQRGKFTGGIDEFGNPAVGGLELRADWKKLKIEMSPGWY